MKLGSPRLGVEVAFAVCTSNQTSVHVRIGAISRRAPKEGSNAFADATPIHAALLSTGMEATAGSGMDATAGSPRRGVEALKIPSGQKSAEPAAPPTKPIFVVLIATMLGFAASIIYSQKVASKLDDNAISIETNASPSIERLSAARGEILRIELAGVTAIQRANEGAPLDQSPLDAAFSTLDRELDAYRMVPFYPNEREQFSVAEEALQFLRLQASDLLTHLSQQDVPAAIDVLRTRLSPTALQADRAIERVIKINADQQHALAVQIPRLRTQAARIGYVLEAFTAILGLVTMGMVSRAIWRYTRLLTAQKRLIEDVAIVNARLYNQALAATRAREELLATVSHDLKHPLSTIRISAEMLRRSAGEAQAEDLAVRIDRSVQRMTRMIADLLDASKIEAGVLRTAPKPEDAASLVNSAAEMFRVIAMEKSIQILPVAPPYPLAALCERELILRVLSNLIGNAIKFSPSGGSIFVVAEELAGHIQFSVTDAGPGISAEDLVHAFERYWQQTVGDRRGSGLGLYIAKGIVEAHGGRIWIKSSPGEGTAVQFTVPRARRDGAFPSASS